MANNANNVAVGKPNKNGALWIAPLDTAVPTDATTPLVSAFKSLGYLNSDGQVNTLERETNDIKAYGGDTVASPITSSSDKYAGTFIEAINTVVLSAVHGDENVTVDGDGNIEVAVNSADRPNQVFVSETVVNPTTVRRVVIPNGKLTLNGDISYKDDEPVSYPYTIDAFPDAAGNTHYEYIAEVTGA